MFGELGYSIYREETEVDAQSLRALQEGVMTVDPIFENYDRDDICTTLTCF